jgi:predicted aspartyl protease
VQYHDIGQLFIPETRSVISRLDIASEFTHWATSEFSEGAFISSTMDIRVELPGDTFLLLTVSKDATIADVCTEVAPCIDSEVCDLVCMSGTQLLLPIAVVGLLADREIYISRISDPPRHPRRPSQVDVEQQEAILERIRQKRIADNQEAARRFNVTSRSPGVRRLTCHINGMSQQMIVDTGSSASFIYANQVTALGLTDLVDSAPRYRQTFSTVTGGTKTIGIIHHIQLAVGDVVTIVSLAVLPGEMTNGLLGIDWLTQNQAIINTAKDCIIIRGKSINFAN